LLYSLRACYKPPTYLGALAVGFRTPEPVLGLSLRFGFELASFEPA
jgi:hypothetical protein